MSLFNSQVIKANQVSQVKMENVKMEDFWGTKNAEGEYQQKISPSVEIKALQSEQLLAQKKQEANLLIEEGKKQVLKMKNEAIAEINQIKNAFQQEISRLEEQKKRLNDEINDLEKEKIKNNQEAETILVNARLEKEKVLNQAEPQIIHAIKHIVGHLVSTEIYTSIEWIRCFVRKVLFFENVDGEIKVYMSERNYEQFTNKTKNELNATKLKATFLSDSSLLDDVCLIETEQGQIKYNITQELDQVLREIEALKLLPVEGEDEFR